MIISEVYKEIVYCPLAETAAKYLSVYIEQDTTITSAHNNDAAYNRYRMK